METIGEIMIMECDKRKDPLVSVIVPIYNVEKYLRRCIDSLLNQTYNSYEVILVDDGSPDHCGEIADEYAEKHSNIKVFHKKNGGLGDARNFGVQQAAGNFVAFVDSDDYVRDTYLSNLVNLMKKYDADVAITAIKRVKEGEILPVKSRFDDYCVTSEEAISEVYTGDRIGWSAYGKLIKKECLLNAPFPDGYYEDSACMYKILEQCDKVAIGDYSANYYYIVRAGSILQRQLSAKHFRIFDICQEFQEFARKKENIPEVVPVMFYRNAIVQLLRCQKMSWNEYCKIFSAYTGYFRKNLKLVIKTPDILFVYKLYYVALCIHPACFKILMMLVDIVK